MPGDLDVELVVVVDPHRSRPSLELLPLLEDLSLAFVFEPLGLVLLEAMAAGCVVLSSDADGPSDLVRAPWGEMMDFSVPDRRTSELIAGICRLVRVDRAQLIHRGSLAAQAAQAYTWRACADVHLAALGQ